MKVELELTQEQIDRLFALTATLPACRFLGNNVPLNGRFISDALSPLISRGNLDLPTKEAIQIQNDASQVFFDPALFVFNGKTKQKLVDKLTLIQNEIKRIQTQLDNL